MPEQSLVLTSTLSKVEQAPALSNKDTKVDDDGGEFSFLNERRSVLDFVGVKFYFLFDASA